MIFHAQLDEDELVGNVPQDPNVLEIKQIIEETELKRFFHGVENLFQFKQNPKNFSGKNPKILSESRFYCKLCLQGFDKRNFIRHCSSYLHLFRCLKSSYPIEYNRLVDPKSIHTSIKFMIKFFEQTSEWERDVFKVPELVYFDNLNYNYNEFLASYADNHRPVYIENINLKELHELNERNERMALDEIRQEELKNTRRPVANAFLQHILDSNEDDFVSIPLPGPVTSNVQESSRFAEFESNLRNRDRGSMKIKNENEVFIKQERDVEMETVNIEQHQNEDGVEIISREYLEQLAAKIKSVIYTNNLDLINQHFIDECTNHLELLDNFELVEGDEFEMLFALFNQASENHNEEVEQPSEPEQPQTIIGNVCIKQEKTYY